MSASDYIHAVAMMIPSFVLIAAAAITLFAL
jgi:hypothetical protein